MSGVCTIKWRW